MGVESRSPNLVSFSAAIQNYLGAEVNGNFYIPPNSTEILFIKVKNTPRMEPEDFALNARIFPPRHPGESPIAAIQNIQIPQDLRRRGIATLIVEKWEEMAKTAGITTLAALNVKPDNSEAREFWKNRGYTIEEPGYRSNINMYKIL